MNDIISNRATKRAATRSRIAQRELEKKIARERMGIIEGRARRAAERLEEDPASASRKQVADAKVYALPELWMIGRVIQVSVDRLVSRTNNSEGQSKYGHTAVGRLLSYEATYSQVAAEDRDFRDDEMDLLELRLAGGLTVAAMAKATVKIRVVKK